MKHLPPKSVAPQAVRRPLSHHVRRFRRRSATGLGRLNGNVRGAIWMFLAVLAMSAMAVIVKALGGRFGGFQLTFLRSGVAVLLIAPFLIRTINPEDLRITRPFLLIGRSVSATLASALMLYSIAVLPLADSQSLSFATVIFLTPLAALFLKEPIGVHRVGAALAGMVGVIVLLRPSGTLSPGAIAAVAGAFLFALTAIQVRLLSRDMPSNAVFLYGVTLLGLFAAVPAFFEWVMPTMEEWGVLILLGVGGAAAQYCFVRAYAVGEAAAIGPVDYTRLIFTTAAGVIWFDETPDIWTFLGASIIVASSLYISWREAKRGGKGTEPDPAA